MIYISKCFDYR